MDSLLEKSDVVRSKGRKWRKIRNTIFFVILFGLAAWFGFYFYYPLGEGIKTGQLNYVVYKGYVFKTYEGKLIQSGFRPSATGGVQSNEFAFSVANKEIAEELMHAGGKTVDLHYKEYLGALPWRGYSNFIVDRIDRISEGEPKMSIDAAALEL